MQTSAGRGEREKGCCCDWFCCVATCLDKDGGSRAAVFCWLRRCLSLFSCLFGALCGCRHDCLCFPDALVVGPNAARISVALPCVSVRVGFQRLFVPVM